MINKDNFLETIFADATPDEFICVSEAKPKSDGTGSWFNNCLPTDRSWRKWDAEKQARAWYFCVSTITGEMNDKGTMVRRGRGQLVKAHCLVLDDIGTKADRPPVEPSWILESSEGNEQWGYMLYPTGDLDRYEALLEYCHRQGWGDAGAGGSYRLMRVPGSANLKPGRGNFRAVVSRWEPDVWELDELITDLGATEADLIFNKSKVQTSELGAVVGDNIDPLLEWLQASGRVVSDDGAWIKIQCPWHERHTSGEDSAGYSPLGRGDGDWVQTRGFKCLHEHCRGESFRSFMKVMGEAGAPKCSGSDPLPWLQARYTYVVVGQRVADLQQRGKGGDWMLDFTDWGNLYKARVMVPGRDAPVDMKTAFLESPATTKAVNAVYDPLSGIEPHVTRGDQLNVNLYIPPSWGPSDKAPVIFLEHIRFLFGDYSELFLDWLAWKYQNPGKRSWAVVCVADAAFGIGRSWLKKALTESLQGHVRGASLAQVIGKGGDFNDWGTACQFVVVEEAKDNLTKEDFYSGYEAFKQNVDNNVVKMTVNPKYGKMRDDYLYFNALIFTNHTDAMVLPEDDRRVCVLENPRERRSVAYYENLNECLRKDEPKLIYNYLMARDVSKFDHIYPIMTDAKRQMQEQVLSPVEEIQEAVLSELKGDIVTRELLMDKIRETALQLGYNNVYNKPGGVAKHMWLKCHNLRGEKHGARYTVKGVVTEIRAWRNLALWKEADQMRDTERLLNELDLNLGANAILRVVGEGG
jgi:hypothetical protein